MSVSIYFCIFNFDINNNVMKKFIYIGIVLSVLLHGVLNAFFIETLSRTSIVLSGVSGILLSIVLGIAFYDLYKLNKKYLSE